MWKYHKYRNRILRIPFVCIFMYICMYVCITLIDSTFLPQNKGRVIFHILETWWLVVSNSIQLNGYTNTYIIFILYVNGYYCTFLVDICGHYCTLNVDRSENIVDFVLILFIVDILLIVFDILCGYIVDITVHSLWIYCYFCTFFVNIIILEVMWI